MSEDMSRIEIGTIVPDQSEKLRREFAFYEKGDKKGLILREEILKENPLRLRIPIAYLHGTQRAEGFTSARAKRAEKALRSGGVSFLEENPIIVAVDFVQGQGIAATYIEDGHHRSLRAPKTGIHEIPSLVVPIDRFSQAKHRALIRICAEYGQPIDVKTLSTYSDPKKTIAQLEEQAADATKSFNEKGIIQNNQLINGVSSLSDLTAKFASF